jgi:hypothetical protein
MASRSKTQEMFDFTCAMWNDPLVYHYQETGPIPADMPSVFLVGPTSREDVLNFKWRPYGVHYLRKHGFSGVIVVPEAREDDWGFKESFPTSIVSWERERILRVNKVIAWIPRHPTQLPGRVTNTEVGFLAGMAYADPDRFRDRFIWGYPPNAWKVKAEDHWINDVAGIRPFHDLEMMCEQAALTFKKGI